MSAYVAIGEPAGDAGDKGGVGSEAGAISKLGGEGGRAGVAIMRLHARYYPRAGTCCADAPANLSASGMAGRDHSGEQEAIASSVGWLSTEAERPRLGGWRWLIEFDLHAEALISGQR